MRKNIDRSYDDFLEETLKSPKQAVAYLNAALTEGEFENFLMALRDVAKVYGGGMSKLAKKTGLNRENLYTILSKKGNPGVWTLETLLEAMGFRLAVQLKKAS